MGKYVIIADSTCDLNEEFLKKYDIEIVQGHIILPDKTEIYSFQKWENYTREEFYSNLKKNPNGYTTAPPSVGEFAEAFEKWASQGYDILAMTISSGISGAFNFTQQARNLVLAKYPKVTISCFDSLRFGPGFGLMAVYAAQMRNDGKTLKEVVEWLEKNKNRFHQAGWMDDLSFVAKKGRITHSKAFLGTLAGIKTIGEQDYNGLTTVIGKAKGARTAFELLINYMENTIENAESQIIFIAQTNRLPQAEEYKKLIEERFHPKAVYINDVFPSCGINVGPGLMASYYMGVPISEGLERERKIVEDFNSKMK